MNNAKQKIILKKLPFFVIMVLVGFFIVNAHADDFSEAKKLIDAKTECSKLTDGQFEQIGDYLMEQMHPGEAHEVMDKMMGGDGSESLRLVHISIAKRAYCNDAASAANYGMMTYGTMGGFGNTNYGGMRSMMWGNNIGYGMMGNYGNGHWIFVNFFGTLLIIGLVILVYLWIIKIWREIAVKKK